MRIFCVRCIITDTFLVLWTVDCGELSANIKGIEFCRGILIVFSNIFMFAFKRHKRLRVQYFICPDFLFIYHKIAITLPLFLFNSILVWLKVIFKHCAWRLRRRLPSFYLYFTILNSEHCLRTTVTTIRQANLPKGDTALDSTTLP